MVLWNLSGLRLGSLCALESETGLVSTADPVRVVFDLGRLDVWDFELRHL